jgi:FkbM family methyltransferase
MEEFQTNLGPFWAFNNDQNFYFHLKHGGFWEAKLLEDLMPFICKAETILDIGAHIGSHSFVYGFFNPNAKIYAFEPQKKIYDLLSKNVSIRPNVIPINKCVGHTNMTCNLSRNAKCGENSDIDICYGNGPIMNLGGVSIGGSGEEVEMITIDSLNLETCDFIKIDVEGAEGLVIEGATETIRKFKPIICFEWSPYLDNKPMEEYFHRQRIPTVQELLIKLGYTVFKFLEGDNWLAFPQ